MSIIRIQPGPRMSQAVAHGGVLYISGQVAAPGQGAGAQTEAILARIEALLTEAGVDRSKLLSATIWLADMADFAAMNAVWDNWIDTNHPPARATVEAKLAVPELRVEIAAIAALG